MIPAGDIAREVGYTSDYITRLAREKKIKGKKVGKKWLVDPVSVAEMLRRKKEEKELRSRALRRERKKEQKETKKNTRLSSLHKTLFGSENVESEEKREAQKAEEKSEVTKKTSHEMNMFTQHVHALVATSGAMLAGVLLGVVVYAAPTREGEASPMFARAVGTYELVTEMGRDAFGKVETFASAFPETFGEFLARTNRKGDKQVASVFWSDVWCGLKSVFGKECLFDTETDTRLATEPDDTVVVNETPVSSTNDRVVSATTIVNPTEVTQVTTNPVTIITQELPDLFPAKWLSQITPREVHTIQIRGDQTSFDSTNENITKRFSDIETSFLTHALEVSGDAHVTGQLTVGGTFVATSSVTSYISLTSPVVTATSTTATSTFAGGLAVETTGFVYDFATNKVGIGTSSPATRLTLQQESDALGGGFRVDQASDSDYFEIVGIGDRVALGLNGTEIFSFLENGSVGIGTSSPTYNLEVIGDARFSSAVDATYFTATSTTATTTLAGGFAIKDSGFVYDYSTNFIGINTASPTYRFDVTGDGRFTGLVDAERFVATSTTATSTFAGGFTVGTSDFVIDPDANRIGIGTTNLTSLLTLGYTTSIISTDTLNGSDSKRIQIAGGGTTGTERGASIEVMGNEYSGEAGDLSLYAGNSGVSGQGALRFFTGNVLERLTITADGNIGIGSTTPAQLLSVAGNTYITGGFGVGIATTTAGVFQTSGNGWIGGNLVVVGDSTVFGDSTTLGESTSDTLVVNSSIGSNLIPTINATYDIGSPSFFWDDGYFDTITANNISAASSTISGTQAQTFTLNSDNASTDDEDIDLVFFRGTVVPNALLSWNSTLDKFDFNQPLFIQNDSATTTIRTLDVWGSAGQTADLLRVASSSGSSFFNILADGSVGVGTTTPGATFSVAGNALFAGDLTASYFVATSTTASTFPYASSTALTVSGTIYNETLTSGRVPYITTGGAFTDDSDLTFDGVTLTATDAIFTRATSTNATTTNFAISNTLRLSGLTPARLLTVTSAGVATSTDIASWIAGTSGQITVTDDADGTVTLSLPSELSFTNASTTQLSVTDQAWFGGTATSTFTSNGYLGVLTASPTYPLEVTGQGRFSGLVDASHFVATSTTATSTFAGGLAIETSGFVYDYTTNRVGIGTASAASQLHVYNASANVGGRFQSALLDSTVALSLINDARQFDLSIRGDSSDSLIIRDQTAGSDRFTLTSGGDVGIGTTTPAAKLDVQGNISAGTYSNSTNVLTLNLTGTAAGVNLYRQDATGPITSASAGDRFFLYNPSGRFSIGTDGGNSAIFNVTSGGNVGIGGTSPSNKFVVRNSGGSTIPVVFETQDYVSSSAGSRLYFSSGSATGNTYYGINVQTGGGTSWGNLVLTPSGGNVGIGTTTPDAILTVQGGHVAIDNNLFFQGRDTAGSRRNLIGADSSNNVVIGNTSAWNNIIFQPGASEAMRIDSSGNVGIGTTSPATKLHVANTSGTTLVQSEVNANSIVGFSIKKTGSTNQEWRIVDGQSANGALDFYDVTDARSVMTLNGSGSVGIGTTNPATNRKLHIQDSGLVVLEIESTGNQAGVQLDNNSGTFDIYMPADSNDLRFYDSTADRVTIQNGGNVGIGTTSPDRKLHVFAGESGATPYSLSQLVVENSGRAGIDILSGSSERGLLNFGDSGNAQAGVVEYDHSTDFMRFVTNGSEKVRIDSSGNIGIGTTTPVGKLHVYNSVATNFVMERDATNQWRFLLSGGSLQFQDGISSQIRMVINSSGNVGIGTTSPNRLFHISGSLPFIRLQDSDYADGFGEVAANGGTLSLRADENAGVADSYIDFRVDGSERMRIDSSGNVGIGTTTPDSTLEVEGADSGIKITAVDGTSSTGNARLTFENDAGSTADILLQRSGLSTDLQFRNGGNTGILINTSGNTTVSGDLTLGSNRSLYITGSQNAFEGIVPETDINLMLGTGSGSEPRIYLYGSANGQTSAGDVFIGSASNTGDIELFGDVGIGTTSPEQKLDVRGVSQFIDTSGTNNRAIIIGRSVTDASSKSSAINARHWLNAEEPVVLIGSAIDDGTSNIVNIGGGYSNNNSATELRFYTAANNATLTGTRAMTIDSSGNVGIGATSPAQLLHLNVASGNVITQYSINGTTEALNGVAGSSDQVIAGSVQGDSVFRNQGGNILFSTDSGTSAQLYLANGGNVGIGTTSPSGKLVVTDSFVNTPQAGANLIVAESTANNGVSVLSGNSATGSLLFGDTSDNFVAGFRYDHSSDQLDIYGNNASRISLDSSGNVGIGTTTPGNYSASADNLVVYTGPTSSGGITIATGDTTKTGNIFFGDGMSGSAFRGAIRYQHSDDSFQFNTAWNGADAGNLVLDSSGNVGIGTSSPDTLLHLESTDPRITLTDTSLAGSANHIIRGADEFLLISADDGNDQTTSSLRFNVDGSERLRINSAGSVGIGTTDSSGMLEVDNTNSTSSTLLTLTDGEIGGGAHTQILFTRSAAAVGDTTVGYINSVSNDIRFNATDDLFFQTAGADVMTLTDTGRVGIGTTSPGAYLDIEQVAVSGQEVLRITSGGGSKDFSIVGNSGNEYALFSETGATDPGQLEIKESGTTEIMLNTGGVSYFNTGSNVGIGTAVPEELLNVFGTNVAIMAEGDGITKAGFKIKTNNTLRWDINSPSGQSRLAFVDGSSNEVLTLAQLGNVGIGTTTPSDKLAVVSSATTHRALIESTGSNSYVGLRLKNDARSYELQVEGVADAFRIYDNTAGAERLRIDSSGNVGIGTTTPSSKLHVSNIAGNSIVTVESGEGSWAQLLFQGDLSGTEYVLGRNDVSNLDAFVIGRSGGSNDFVINSSGNVGIGTTTPDNILTIAKDGSTTANAPFVEIHNSHGSIDQGSILGGVTWTGADISTGGTGEMARINIVAENSGTQYSMRFGTRDGTSDIADRMVIDNEGNVGIGTTTPASTLDVARTATSNANPILNVYGLLGASDRTVLGLSTTELGSDSRYFIQTTVDSDGTPSSDFVVTTSGNVGIGIAEPSYNLQVHASSDPTITVGGNLATGTTGGTSTFRWFANNGAVSNSFRATYYKDASNDRLTFVDGGAVNVLTMVNGGNIGIGETSPDELLHLTSSTTFKPDLKIENTNADANPSRLSLFKTSASQADGDELGQIRFVGLDSGGAETNFGYILGSSEDITNTDEAGSLEFFVPVDGTFQNFLKLNGYNGSVGEGEIVFNDTSADIDFRVESDNKINALFVDGSSGGVGIGTSSPDYALDVEENGASYVVRWSESGSKAGFLYSDVSGSGISFNEASGFGAGAASIYSGGNFNLYLGTGQDYKFNDSSNNELVRIDSSGNIGIGEENPGSTLHVRADSAPGIRIATTTGATGANSFIFGLATGNDNFLTGSVEGDTAIAARSGGKLMLGTSATQGATQSARLTITGAGFVGINDTSPQNELHVDGRAYFEDGLLVGSNASAGVYPNQIRGSYTSDGSDTVIAGLNVSPSLTGANGDTAWQTLFTAGQASGSSITTQGNSETITNVTTMYLSEPGITIGTGDTVTNATTLKITGAPTEGTNNYALWIDDGISRFDGDVGIGLTTPESTLHVFSGDAGSVTVDTSIDDLIVENSTAGGISIYTPDASTSSLAFGSPSDANGANIQWNYNSNLMTVGTRDTGASLRFDVANGSEAMRITSTGSVGIGTTSPTIMLDINSGTTNTVARFYSTDAGANITLTDSVGSSAIEQNSASLLIKSDPSGVVGSSDIRFQVDGSSAMTIDSAGNVGIGSTTPASKLVVSGGDIWLDNSNSLVFGATLGTRIVGNTGITNELQFLTQNTARMTIDGSGRIGIGTSTPISTLSVQGSLCVRDTGSCGTTAGTIYATTASITDIDLAENYPTIDDTISAGEIVTLDEYNNEYIRRASYGDKPFGIISTAPGITLGGEDTAGKPVALKGRVPVKVNGEGGAIAIGDRITLSVSEPGVGMKAIESSRTVGIALEPYTATTTTASIMVAVENEYTFVSDEFALKSENTGFGTSSPYAKLSVVNESAGPSFIVEDSAGGDSTPFIIDTDGKVGIGTSTPTAQLHTTGSVRFENFGAGALQTDAEGNLTVSSDERLKDVTGTFDRGLAELREIEPIVYHWNDFSGFETKTLYAGFSAQDVQTEIPEAVGQDKYGFLTLADRPILAAAVNAIKELDLDLQSLADEETLFSEADATSFTGRFLTKLIAWFADTANGIGEVFASTFRASDELCINDTCVSEDQLQALLSGSSVTTTTTTTTTTNTNDTTSNNTTSTGGGSTGGGDTTATTTDGGTDTATTTDSGADTATTTDSGTDTSTSADDTATTTDTGTETTPTEEPTVEETPAEDPVVEETPTEEPVVEEPEPEPEPTPAEEPAA